MLLCALALAGTPAADADAACRAEAAERHYAHGGPTRQQPLHPPVQTGLRLRAGAPGEAACPVFVEGDEVDVRCSGPDGDLVRAIAKDWYSATNDDLVVWVAHGTVTAAMFLPTVSRWDLHYKTVPAGIETATATRCVVRLILGVDGTPLAGRAQYSCPTREAAESLAMTARFAPPCIEGGAWPVGIAVSVWVQ